MNITVVLCTYNRCGILAMTLDSVAASTPPDSVDWELLVVDNNSSDQTRAVVEEFSNRHPRLCRYVFEPQPGKSFALNTAVREARGEVLAFVDDDVTVEPSWLQNLTTPLQDVQWAGVGGRTLPAESFSPPRWMAVEGPYSMGGVLFAQFDLGDKPCELGLNQAPYGANMAFRKQAFEKYGGFRTDLGPSPNRETPRPNEDTEFGRRLMAAGEHIRYEPSAVVRHPVPKDRLKKEYFLTWWFDYGRAIIREVGKRPDIGRIPRYYFSVPSGIVGTLMATLRWMVDFNPQRRFFMKALVWYLAGQVVETYRQSRRQGS
jgi:glycosyltransferase involved in cell wall biosynthesis